jgi:hypothetical protein
MSIKKFIFLACIAFFAYFLAYKIISKPLTDGEIVRLIDKKTALLKKTGSQRLIILAGSNGRFSHSCAEIQRLINRPCINASLMAGIGIDYILEVYRPLIREGDIIYMPYEYEQYNQTRNTVFSGPDNSILWRTDLDTLSNLGIERTVRASFFADAKYFIHGIIEMGLSKRGIKRRFDESSINEQGDQIGHTRELGSSYESFLKSKSVTIPLLQLSKNTPYSTEIISQFLLSAKKQGITIIGGLPTTFDDIKIPDQTREELQKLFRNTGQQFIETKSLSQYPRSCFFDMPYHLNEECQKEHSRRVHELLKPYLSQHQQ